MHQQKKKKKKNPMNQNILFPHFTSLFQISKPKLYLESSYEITLLMILTVIVANISLSIPSFSSQLPLPFPGPSIGCQLPCFPWQ